MAKIYFDYASTTPVDPEVAEAMAPYLHDRFGNASSPHSYGREAQKALEESREMVARCIGADPGEVVFNSGATEANNHAIIGTARAKKRKGRHLIVSSIEHHSVLSPVAYLQREEGFNVTYVPVDRNGWVDPVDVREAITPETILIAVMMASNEIGTIQPVADIGRIAREHGVSFLVDAVQAVGHIPVNVQDLAADMLSLSAHKFYGPKGSGALYIRQKTAVSPFMLGGDQEHGRRASTQNIAGIVGLAKALELCQQRMAQEAIAQTGWRDRLIQQVPKLVPGVSVNGHLTQRLPNNAHFSFEKLASESLLLSLDMDGICASMGSACSSGAMEISHVLRAIGTPEELAQGALRISLGRWTRDEHIDYFLRRLPDLVKAVRI